MKQITNEENLVGLTIDGVKRVRDFLVWYGDGEEGWYCVFEYGGPVEFRARVRVLDKEPEARHLLEIGAISMTTFSQRMIKEEQKQEQELEGRERAEYERLRGKYATDNQMG